MAQRNQFLGRPGHHALSAAIELLAVLPQRAARLVPLSWVPREDVSLGAFDEAEHFRPLR